MKKRAKQPMKSKPFWPFGLALFLILFAIDQWTKRAILSGYAFGESSNVFPGLWFTLVKNTGAAWSSFPDSNGAFIWISIVALGLLVFFMDEFKTIIEKICYTLLLAGLFGNLADRALLGYVVDFIDLGWWPVFNVADSCISVSVVVFIVHNLLKKNVKKK